MRHRLRHFCPHCSLVEWKDQGRGQEEGAKGGGGILAKDEEEGRRESEDEDKVVKEEEIGATCLRDETRPKSSR